MSNKSMSLVLSAFIAASLSLSGCSSQATLQDQAAAVSVDATQAISGYLSKGPVYIGTVQPGQEVQVLPKIPGKVASVKVEVGSTVKKGDTLFTLDATDLQNAFNQAQATLGAAQASVQATIVQQQSSANTATGGSVQAKSGVIQAENSVNQAQNSVTQAENSVKTAKQALDDATTNKQRNEQLYSSNAISKSQLDPFETAFVKAQADYDNAQQGLQTAQAALTAAKQAQDNASAGYEAAKNQVSIAQSQAGVEASRQNANTAQAALQAAKDRLDEAAVTSPFDGIVGVKNVEVGDYINPDIPPAKPVLVIANLDQVKVITYIPADQINQVKIGDSVMVKAISLNTYFKGQIKNISPLDQNGKGYPVEVAINNSQLQLKKGMVTEVRLISAGAKEGVLIPTAAILHDQQKDYVYVMDKNSAKATRKDITISDQDGAQTLITGGIKEGESIITSPLGLISDGTKVAANSKNQDQ